ncbi:ACP S-malonyltransferase [Marimonas arenosa]|uniref:[acyl-carrier-protein] S-malonyltransferase n=1 Tax=Marimonas arenosa TaxID=1795305 RepID=A0AAE3WCQ0_9RHOB|nr:ACP S-malonyltransferase [Marimonas arenosa]MDQ2090811.1 ACP S-malonyltransferase [Marimonas arenosa]
MTRRAVLVCPGRGTYTKTELGYLARHHAGHPWLADFDAARVAAGQETVTALDSAARYSVATYSRGDVASPLIYASALLDAQALAEDIEIVAVTGNSMGWYIALAAAGAVSPKHGFTLVNTMGRLMQEHLIGGQVVYPHTGEDWRPDPARKAELLALAAEVDTREGHLLRLSIDLGGLLVLAGNEAGLAAFEAAVPPAQSRFPMRLANHAAFHTALQKPVAEEARETLTSDFFSQPVLPLIDGRGAIWWPHACDTDRLHAYTLGHQVTEAYDFTRAIQVAAREFAPDLFILTGPGDTLGGAVAQSLIQGGWRGMTGKADFQRLTAQTPMILSMGREDQRRLATDPA